MKELLQGRRFGFAPRAQLAGVGLGLAIATTLLDLMAWFEWGSRDTNGFVIAAYWLVLATAVVCALASLAALAEATDVIDEDRGLARLDLLAVLVAALLYAGSAALRAGRLGDAAAEPAPFLLAVGGLVVLIVGAVLAANLYAAREWEELEEEIVPERHRRRRAAGR